MMSGYLAGEASPQTMRYLRTNDTSPLSTLRTVASWLDSCWWYVGGNGFSMTEAFLRRMAPRNWTGERTREYWERLLTEYVDDETIDGRVGRPGFFSRLGDAVDFSWTTLFAIEGAELPASTIGEVMKVERAWFDPLENLPPDVVVVARDIDSAYQDFGFREDWMFKSVAADLRRRRLPCEEITAWPHAGRGSEPARRPAR
jgi:hypothetical protein